MGIVLMFLKSWWKEILFALVLVAVVAFIYNKGYNNGERDCKEAWQKQEVARVEALNKKIEELKTKSEELAVTQNDSTVKVSKNLNKIISDIKVQSTKPTNTTQVVNQYTTVTDCKPSESFVETWNEIARQANAN